MREACFRLQCNWDFTHISGGHVCLQLLIPDNMLINTMDYVCSRGTALETARYRMGMGKTVSSDSDDVFFVLNIK